MPLPSPYEPPWKRLGEDLVAVGAWFLLKLRELGRRNREGSLPLPTFWPRRWPQLFWPLVLAIVLLALVAGVGLVGHRVSLKPPSGPEAAADTTARGSEPPSAPLEWVAPPESLASPGGPGEAEPQTRLEEPPGTETAEGRENPNPELGETAEEAPEGESGEENGLENRPENGEEEQLRAQLNQGDRESLLVAIRPDPDNATLVLQLSADFRALPPASRLQQAERWQARAEEWGYSHLELVDGEGQLVGREAQVGEGMILFEAAGAGGSPAMDGEVGKRDGMFRDRAGGTGGALGSAPDARSRRWSGLLGRQRGASDPATHGGVHGQPPAGAG